MRLIGFGRIVLFVLVLLGAPLANAIAEGEPDGAWKPPPIGTKVEYNFGAKYEVTRIEGSKYYVKGARTTETHGMDFEWYIYKGTFHSMWADGQKVSFDQEALDSFFPLKIGNKTTVAAERADGWKWKTAFKVTKYKEVETLLGKRPVFVVAFLEKGKGHKAKGWGYYDPEPGIWDGGLYQWGEGDNQKLNWRLTHLEVPE